MLLQRERPVAPFARALMPAPAPLPSLPDALRRRAAVFGPVEIDEDPTVPRARLSRRLAIFGAGFALASYRPARARVSAQLAPKPAQLAPVSADAALVAWAAELPEIDAALTDRNYPRGAQLG